MHAKYIPIQLGHSNDKRIPVQPGLCVQLLPYIATVDARLQLPPLINTRKKNGFVHLHVVLSTFVMIQDNNSVISRRVYNLGIHSLHHISYRHGWHTSCQ